MTPDTHRPDEMLEKIGEIMSYYDACETFVGRSALISKSMLAFTMGYANKSEIEPVLEILRGQGKILSVHDDAITFSPGFLATAG